jgi:hypothetical protein
VFAVVFHRIFQALADESGQIVKTGAPVTP